MPVPTSISELSTTPGSNSPSGSDSPSVLDDHQRTAYAFIRTLSDEKLDSADAVLLTGAQTAAGVKTFSSGIVANVTGNVTGNTSGTAANVTGTVAIANGGTGQTTAAAAFGALKQAATSSATGVVELANDAEAQAATDTARALVPANLAAVLLGIGQTRGDFTASRSFATIYTNTTGRLIEVTVTAGVTGGGSFTLELGPTTVTQTVSASENRVHFFTVKPSETYRVSLSAGSLVSWYELR